MAVSVTTKQTAFSELIKGAGVLLSSFDPTNPVIEDANILFATSGGINATAAMTTLDWAEDVDGAPKNLKEFKQLDMWECKVSGTAASITLAGAKIMAGAADVVGDSKLVLRNNIVDADFADLWFVVPKTKDNVISYVHLSNALSNTGLAIQTTDKEKGKFAFEFMGHYSSDAQNTVPFEYGEITVTETPAQG